MTINYENIMMALNVAMVGAVFVGTLRKNIEQQKASNEKPLNIVEEAKNAAETAVRYAEQLYKVDSTIDRKAIATQYAVNIIKALGFEITPRVAEIINGAIEAAVLLLPPTKKPENTQNNTVKAEG
ncbi:hypothetical protein DNHGIG_07870 [Collibacillus ludicampi]|uniref:Phage holin n=1 Tax=Collibacillus ludicampi TaxID=2771369 RepID=A0AAV4LC60_9BACL|nr:phage holin, LLH family [Collibacillus ludicampi]GIM45238.1 hypothetical protein DNHGIG_07870 [Collibacillus ludicampi]